MDYDMDKIIEKARRGETKELFDNIPAEHAQKIKGLLNDKEACEKMLNSPQAQKILEMLKKGGKF